MAAGALAATPVLDASVKLASSLTAQLAAALGTPLLKFEETRIRSTKKGTTSRTTSGALPAWDVVAGATLWLWSGFPATGAGPLACPGAPGSLERTDGCGKQWFCNPWASLIPGASAACLACAATGTPLPGWGGPTPILSGQSPEQKAADDKIARDKAACEAAGGTWDARSLMCIPKKARDECAQKQAAYIFALKEGDNGLAFRIREDARKSGCAWAR